MMGEKQQMAAVFGLMLALLGIIIICDMTRSPIANQMYVAASVMVLLMNFVYTVGESGPRTRKFPRPEGPRPNPPGWKLTSVPVTPEPRYICENCGEEYVEEARVLRPRMLVDELGRNLRRELDFLHEASATQNFHAAFENSDRFNGPEVLWDLTTGKVLTLERLSGRRISYYIENGTSEQKQILAEALFDLYMKQFFELGFFHADPHPGNLLVDDQLRINVIDFGLTGRLTGEMQSALGTAILAAKMKDVELLSAVFEDLGIYTEGTDRSLVRSDILSMMETYMGMPMGRVDVGSIFERLVEIAHRNSLFLPRSVTLMGKALVTVAAISRGLNPRFDAMAAIAPYVKGLIKKKFSYESIRKSAISMVFHGAGLLKQGPADLRRMIRKVLSGELSMNFRHVGLEKLIGDLDRASNRLAFSIVVASLVIGSSLILHAGAGPLLFGLPILGIVGYVFAAVLGLWLVWAILRSGRM